MAAPTQVLVVGASLAAVRVAEALRAQGADSRITIVGDERHLPYDRPPLSKGILTGDEAAAASLLLHGDLGDLGVELSLGRRATSLDTASRTVSFDDGSVERYDELVIATGASARRLPACDGLDGVHTLRTIDDAMAIRAELAHASNVVVVGAGFVGSEVASSVRELGLDVVVLEAAEAPLGRALGPVLGARLGRFHADHGSRLRCDAVVERAEGAGRVERLVLRGGDAIDADLVVVGVGSVPNTGWLAGTPIDIVDGVHCDERGRADGVEHVHAVGDVARWYSPRHDDRVRTEHWSAAGDQAMAVAADLLDRPAPAEAVPYVWSDQFGHRIQLGGRCTPTDRFHIARDDERGIVAIAGREGRLTAALTVDDGKQFGALRRLLAKGASWDDALECAER